ncbi:MAG: hypothetical protein JXB23_06870 [Candidatus Aminicenantes bacterium]|nr:hypothetical protein [Candidatus Aminicenantes bacterium]
MTYQIELTALRTILFATLSCRCPVSEETERALFQEYFRLKKQGAPVVSFDSILEIADRNPQRTPLHNLFQFCSYSKDEPTAFRIVLNDAVRYLCSKHHFDMVQGSLEMTGVTDRTSYHVCHMLLPVQFDPEADNRTAVFNCGDHAVRFLDVFFPPELAFEEKSFYAIHMGTILCPLTQSQIGTIQAHLKLIREFDPMVRRVSSVSFLSYGPSGNHSAQIADRFRRHYPD